MPDVVFKVLEKIIRKQMDDFLLRRNYPSEKHHGFKVWRLYVSSLLDLYESELCLGQNGKLD